MRNVSDGICRENRNTNFMPSTFSPSLMPLIMWKNSVEPNTPQMTCNTAHAHCIVGNKGYRHVVRICNTYCFSATIFTRTRFSVSIMHTFTVLLIDIDAVEKYKEGTWTSYMWFRLLSCMNSGCYIKWHCCFSYFPRPYSATS